MDTLRLRKRPAGGFLAQYDLDRKYLLRPDRSRGIPGLRMGVDAGGQPILIKLWPRETSKDESDLRDIWRNEIRQLHRLSGTSGVGDHIVELVNTGEDPDGFYLVLNPGQRLPLASLMTRTAPVLWLDNPTALSNRFLIWQNLRRVAFGIGILHGQGLLHRYLNRWAILTSGREEPDFQLTGFEWSIRLVGAEKAPVAKRSGPVPRSGLDSFLKDWQQFGELCVDLLAIDKKGIANRAIPNHEVSASFTADEIRLIRELLRVLPAPRTDGDYITERIDQILASLGMRVAGQDFRHYLGLSLGATNSLSGSIREASEEQQIEMDDIEGQLSFVRDDLSENPMALSLKLAGQPDRFKLLLRGAKLTYHIEDFEIGRERQSSHWTFASCSRADLNGPNATHVIKQVRVNGSDFELMPTGELRRRYRALAQQAHSWEQIRTALKPTSSSASAVDLLRRALWLTQIVEYLIAAADVFPVEVVSGVFDRTADPSNGHVNLFVRGRVDEERQQLSRALLLNDLPTKRLRTALLEEDIPEENVWTLTDGPQLGERSPASTEWRFAGEDNAEDGKLAYRFVGDRAAPVLKAAFLIPARSVGRDFQLKRRLKYLKTLEQHAELARMLSDPRYRILKSEESIEADDDFSKLDESKQEALRSIVETVPLFLVQGPPGVGKTRLVRDLVRRRFKDDPSTRMLLSAQSNYAIDHLLEELEKVLSVNADDSPLTVRCRSKDKRDEGSRFDVGQQAAAILHEFSKSELVRDASRDLNVRVERLSKSYSSIQNDGEAQGGFGQRAFEGLILRSANAVFATTNSADLERLIEEKGQFDWVVIEESGKATGGELLAPLLLSHRRLMIGDHKQLAPFGSDAMLRLLQAPTKLHQALGIGNRMIGRAFRDGAIDEIFSDIEEEQGSEADQEFSKLCLEASRVLFMFERIVDSEFTRQGRESPTKRARPIAHQLTKQHRMHPAIAKVVSAAFYEDRLKTDEARERYFLSSECPVISMEPARLPETPLVWVDMPWLQTTMNLKQGDLTPAWHNPDEVNATLHALGLLAVRKGTISPPSLAVISPYSQQTKRLEKAITQSSRIQLKNLQRFAKASKQERYCHTVDSFQGSEADVVIVSLVRNNHHGSIRAALGFLSDPRRMNVLLSRSKWRLIVIGSLSFLDAVVSMAKTQQDAEQIRFLGTVLATLRADPAQASIVPYAKLCGVS